MHSSLVVLLLAGCAGPVTGDAPAPPADTGVPVQCTEEGQMFVNDHSHESTAYCCEGLVEAMADPVPCDAGQEVAGPGAVLCVACGDGACGLMETWCNCLVDCDSGEVGPTE